MKFILWAFAFWLAASYPAAGQGGGVTVELVLEQDRFLPAEELVATIRVGNLSGHALELGKHPDWLTFSVSGRDNYVVSKLGDVPVEGELSLQSSLSATRRVNLTPYFNFLQPGRYQVTATANFPEWNLQVTSRPRVFDVVQGTRLKNIEVGLPDKGGKGGAPELRHYILQQAAHAKQLKLYLRVTDNTESRTFKVFPLCQMTAFSNPEAQVDRDSNIHVLNQDGARTFSYSVVDPQGELILRRTYEYGANRPHLRSDPDGKLFVAGGTQRYSANDFPRPLPPPETQSTLPPVTPDPKTAP